MNIVQALDDPRVFRDVIKDRSTWSAWRGFLKALFGLPMDEAEAALFHDCTGRTTLPTAVFGAAWLVCGRRGGKSFALALIAVFLACFRDYRPHLAMGERATVVIVAADRRQARVISRPRGSTAFRSPSRPTPCGCRSTGCRRTPAAPCSGLAHAGRTVPRRRRGGLTQSQGHRRRGGGGR